MIAFKIMDHQLCALELPEIFYKFRTIFVITENDPREKQIHILENPYFFWSASTIHEKTHREKQVRTTAGERKTYRNLETSFLHSPNLRVLSFETVFFWSLILGISPCSSFSLFLIVSFDFIFNVFLFFFFFNDFSSYQSSQKMKWILLLQNVLRHNEFHQATVSMRSALRWFFSDLRFSTGRFHVHRVTMSTIEPSCVLILRKVRNQCVLILDDTTTFLFHSKYTHTYQISQ